MVHSSMCESLDIQTNIRSLKRTLKSFPHHYQGLDANRMTLLYFTCSALDMTSALDQQDIDRFSIIEWVYSQQIVDKEHGGRTGFASSPYSGMKFSSQDPEADDRQMWFVEGHLAMTYSALVTLLILGDDLGRVHRKEIVSSLAHYRLENGSFRCLGSRDCESDVRFVYCACAISEILGDWSMVDVEKTTNFILSCQSFDGGFGMNSGQEGHGGSTYCAVASLALMRTLQRIEAKDKLVKWCLDRQGNGFQGRPNKPVDTCYSFWIGATLKMLGGYEWTCLEDNRKAVLECASTYGGFGKLPDSYPDALHSHFGLAGLALMGLDGLVERDVVLGLSMKSSPRPVPIFSSVSEFLYS